MKDKPIYLIVTGLLPEPGVWQGSYVEDQANALIREGTYKVVVMKPYSCYGQGEDYSLSHFRVLRFKDYTLPSWIYPNAFCDWLSGRSLLKKLCQENIDPMQIAVCHTHVGSLAHYGLTIKNVNPKCLAVVQHHGFDVMGLTSGKFHNFEWHRKLCVRYGVKMCNAVDLNIGVSQLTLQYVKDNPGINLKHEYVLYNGVDTSLFSSSIAHRPSSITHKPLFTIGCIANFWPLKDQMTLLRALNVLVADGERDIKVKFVGHGATLGMCRQYVTDHNLQDYVDFLSEVGHEQLPAFYQSLDLFVLPSYWEAFGCVYTEAYASGVPFVGVKGQGIGEIILAEEQDRWLIDKGDYQHLAEIILRVMKNPKETQRLTQSMDINDTIGAYVKQIESFK